MNLEKFGEELKQARLEKKVSLMDISTETRINIKYLEAIERGEFHILPQTYVRAFLREYALMIGLDPDYILQQYNLARQEAVSRKSVEAMPQQTSIQDRILTGLLTRRFFSLSSLQRNIAFGIFIIAAIVIIIVLANVNKNSEFEKPITEVPFDRVIRESEATSIASPSIVADSTRVFVAPQKDSLRLEITTLDSVWISLLIDGKKGEEYLFGVNRRRVWTAKERFVVTMGNAGGATFRLNGKNIGSLGKPGAVVRNAIITEANLKN
jgi:transcriptional regulator with XRE-family HTH domain